MGHRIGSAIACDEHVAAARQGSQCRPTCIAQRSTNVADRLNERVLGDHAIRPDLVHQFVLADQPPGMESEESEHQPRPRAQRYEGAARVDQRLARQVNRMVTDHNRLLR